MKLKEYKKLIACVPLILIGVILCNSVKAQEPEFTHDIYQIYEPALYDNHSFNVIDGDLYFTSYQANLGIYADGEYTEINLYEEIGHQVPSQFVKVGDRIYFSVRDGSNSQLAMLQNGEVTLITVNPTGNGELDYLTAFNGSLYFRADSGDGMELWQHDGTTLTEHEIAAGSAESNPTYMEVFGDEMLFTADDVTHGTEVWRVTSEGVVEMIVDLRDGASNGTTGANPYFEEYDGDIYLIGNNGSTGLELYVYDGADITLAADVRAGSNSASVNFITAHQGKLYFSGYDPSDAGTELYVYDGDAATRVSDINPGTASANIQSIVSAGDYLYFRADDGTTGVELHVYDGSTITLFDINTSGNSNFSRGTEYNGNLYFTATDGSTNRLWQHDGTTLTDMANFGSDCFSQRYVLTYGNELYYTGNGGENQSGYHPWVFDGAKASLIVTSGASGGFDSEGEFTELDGKIYFSANDDIHGGELWAYDGQTSSLVADLYEGPDWSSPTDITVFNNKLYFFADVFYEEIEYGMELVEYDGTDINIIDINEGSGGSASFLPGMNIYNDILYFRASDGVNGFELWQYDGTTASMAADIESGSGSSSPGFFQEYNGVLYFQANTIASGKELWSYDGNSAVLVEDLVDGGHTSPTSLTVVNNRLFFVGSTETSGSELYVYDGNTIIEYDINEAGDSYPSSLTAYNGELVFAASDGTVSGTAGRELCVTDGTSAESYQFFEIDPTDEGSQPTDFIEFDGELYFRANDKSTGQELWKYDGNNVTQVHDIFPGDNNSGLSSFNSLGTIGPYLYMGAREEEGNIELYRTDGTTLELVADIGGESGQSYPWAFFPTKDYLYFMAQDHRGDELWRIRKTSEETDILIFSITEQTEESTINDTDHTIIAEMPFGTDLSALGPTLIVSEYATVSPNSSVSQDFSSGSITYTVTSEFGNSQDWLVTVVEGLASSETDILNFALDSQTGDAAINVEDHTVSLEVEFGTNVTSSTPTISLSEGATILPTGSQDFSDPVTYTVTAEDGSTTQDWIVTVTVEEREITAINSNGLMVSSYPNPTSNWLTIVSPYRAVSNMQLFDIQGQLMMAQEVNQQTTISVQNLDAGLYLMKLTNQDITTTTKILIRR